MPSPQATLTIDAFFLPRARTHGLRWIDCSRREDCGTAPLPQEDFCPRREVGTRPHSFVKVATNPKDQRGAPSLAPRVCETVFLAAAIASPVWPVNARVASV